MELLVFVVGENGQVVELLRLIVGEVRHGDGGALCLSQPGRHHSALSEGPHRNGSREVFLLQTLMYLWLTPLTFSGRLE
jgi:hypothetical protein